MGLNTTWANIVVNLSIGLITTLPLLIVYEVARRVPSFSEALFDNKRSIRPHRTPPPLMRSRCRPGSSNWRWPSLLEFLFFSLSKEYIDYSSVINQEENKLMDKSQSVQSSERKSSNEPELMVDSSGLIAPEGRKDDESTLASVQGRLHDESNSMQSHFNNRIERNEKVSSISNEVQCPSNQELSVGKMDNTPYPSRCKYLGLPIDLTGPTSVFHFARKLIKKHESRLESVHLGSLILQTQRVQALSYEDTELLRCIGLDSFIMIRFLRFGFEVCIVFFILACLVLLPTYFSSEYTGVNVNNNSTTNQQSNDDNLTIVTYGYYRVTIDRVEPGSFRLLVSEEIILPDNFVRNISSFRITLTGTVPFFYCVSYIYSIAMAVSFPFCYF